MLWPCFRHNRWLTFLMEDVFAFKWKEQGIEWLIDLIVLIVLIVLLWFLGFFTITLLFMWCFSHKNDRGVKDLFCSTFSHLLPQKDIMDPNNGSTGSSPLTDAELSKDRQSANNNNDDEDGKKQQQSRGAAQIGGQQGQGSRGGKMQPANQGQTWRPVGGAGGLNQGIDIICTSLVETCSSNSSLLC